MLRRSESAPAIKLSDYFQPLYSEADDGLPRFKLLIGGEWRASSDGSTFSVDSPIDGTVIAKAQQASTMDVKAAVESADKARQDIRDIPGIERTEIFEEARREILGHESDFVHVLMTEAGKPERDAEGEVKATADRLKLALEDARRILGEYIPGDWSDDTTGKVALVIREPVGVVAAIAPFNYPLFIAAAKIIPALLAGNSVVVKGASEDPLSLLLFAQTLANAGIPPGALNVLTGRGAMIGDALVSDPRIGLVTFTGSTEVGKHLIQAAGLKKLHLELGGKGMAIVLDDADLELAASKCVEGSLKNAGQRCDAISAILVQDNVADEFVKKAKLALAEWPPGDPWKEKVKVGPLINEDAAVFVEGLVKDACERGAELVAGGRRNGCYFEPTLLDNVPLAARIANEETFGPVLTILRIQSEEDAIRIGRVSRYGLDSCVFTNNFYRMWKLAQRLEVGGHDQRFPATRGRLLSLWGFEGVRDRA